MISIYATKLGLSTRKTSVRAQKIDDSPLEPHGITSARFSLQNSLGRVWFFEETFLLTDTNIEVVLGMFFLALSNTKFQFGTKKLIWRSYTTAEALLTTSWVKLIDKKEFGKAVLNKNSETFVVYVATLKAMTIHLLSAAQIATL